MLSVWSIGTLAAAAEAADASSAARSARSKVGDLEMRVERMQMVCEAMWTLLREKTGLSELDLLNRVNEMDLSDGKLDGKVRRTGHKCPSCNRVIGPRFAQCMYCGQAIQHNPFA